MNELDLLKEIEDLNKQIKTGELEARDLKDSDWDTLVSWWRWMATWCSRNFTGYAYDGYRIQARW